ncbi:hypothetical protein CLCR_10694 [Cladophialophora carrionii]|uniref:BTB domain-containing protein n=1 Tax=Cladophialophora carrionii TaxID=86049 RepID=A0A1C1CX69_9EURO|nr:hypothetical protein CLCR_10694 [Cladophialophora carrionii]
MADKGPPSKKQKTTDGGGSLAMSDIITVVVGPEARKFHVHECLLISKSLFFKKCLQSGMKEQKERTVVLPEDDWKTFNILADLFYAKSVSSATSFQALMSAYMLADKLLMPRFQNKLMDIIGARLSPMHGQRKVKVEEVSWVWKNTTENSKLRRFMVDALHNEIMSGFDYVREEGQKNCTDREQVSNAGRAFQLKMAMMENGALGYELYSKVINCPRARETVYQRFLNASAPYLDYYVENLEEH